MPKPEVQTSFSIALNEIQAEGVASILEMAQAAGCSERHMRSVVSICDDSQLGPRKMIRLSHWLVEERGETRQLEQQGEKPGFLGSRGEAALMPDDVDAENDDDLSPELMLLVGEVKRAQEALDAGDRDTADDHMENLRGIVNAMHYDAITPPDS